MNKINQHKRTTALAVGLTSLLCANVIHGAQCLLPEGCEYLDSEFSTGGGDKVSYVMEVTCKTPQQNIVKYTHWKVSAGSLFGIGRFTAPKKIEFKESNKKELICEY